MTVEEMKRRIGQLEEQIRQLSQLEEQIRRVVASHDEMQRRLEKVYRENFRLTEGLRVAKAELARRDPQQNPPPYRAGSVRR